MIYRHTTMSVAKIAITMEASLVEQVDRLVREHVYPNRSRAIQDAVADKLQRMDRGRLARECAKPDPKFEQALAEEGIGSEIAQWPEH
jgi:Arc/MetJ-type ribon-helix-helix transcriptional regulator